jgi:SHS2 domain-containing protein
MYYTELMDDRGYEEIEHTADWALRVHGEQLEDLFRNAAFGMLALMGITAAASPVHSSSLSVNAGDPEALLVSFLEEILYRAEDEMQTTERITFQAFQSTSLAATLTCRPVVDIQKEIKAVTYNELKISRSADGFVTVIVFDV